MNKKLEAIILMVMCFILGAAIVVQINTVKNNGATNSSNQEEGELKAQVLKMKEKYENQYAELEKVTKELENTRQKATSNNSELEQLENNIKRDNILLGNTDVTGTGIEITLTDGKGEMQLDSENLLIHAENVLAVVNELKNAGAEAIAINGKRVVNTTAISCDGNVIVVNGEKISTPIEITAIGLSEQLATLNREGGTLEYFTSLGKIVDFKKSQNVKIPKYTGVYSFKYANSR